MVKIKITKGLNYDVQAKIDEKLNRCVACSGSGYYDMQSRKGKTIKCGVCKGTGKK